MLIYYSFIFFPKILRAQIYTKKIKIQRLKFQKKRNHPFPPCKEIPTLRYGMTMRCRRAKKRQRK